MDELGPDLWALTFYFQGEPYINPNFLDMVGIANALPDISGVSRARLDRAMAGGAAKAADEMPLEDMLAQRDALLGVMA